MQNTELTIPQKQVIAHLMCGVAVAEEKVQAIADTIELDSDLQVDVSTTSFALHTAKVRLGQLLAQ